MFPHLFFYMAWKGAFLNVEQDEDKQKLEYYKFIQNESLLNQYLKYAN